MKSAMALAVVFAALSACTSTTKGEGPSSSSSSSSGSSSGSTSSSGTSGTTTSSSGSISGAQCQSTCLQKVNECNPDAPDRFSYCQGVCSAGSYTDEQLSCFSATPCGTFQTPDTTLEDVCPP